MALSEPEAKEVALRQPQVSAAAFADTRPSISPGPRSHRVFPDQWGRRAWWRSLFSARFSSGWSKGTLLHYNWLWNPPSSPSGGKSDSRLSSDIYRSFPVPPVLFPASSCNGPSLVRYIGYLPAHSHSLSMILRAGKQAVSLLAPPALSIHKGWADGVPSDPHTDRYCVWLSEKTASNIAPTARLFSLQCQAASTELP